MWISLAIMVVSFLLSYALRPTPQQPNPQTLSDLNIPTIEEGTPLAVVFGDVWADGSFIAWYGDLATQPIKAKGKK